MEPHHANTFTEHRQYLFALAYRMTGSAADAEDLVQEAYLRWRQAEDVRVIAIYIVVNPDKLQNLPKENSFHEPRTSS